MEFKQFEEMYLVALKFASKGEMHTRFQAVVAPRSFEVGIDDLYAFDSAESATEFAYWTNQSACLARTPNKNQGEVRQWEEARDRARRVLRLHGKLLRPW